MLRPITAANLNELERLDTDPAVSAPFEWYGFRSPQARRQRWERDGLIGDDAAILAVVLPDETFLGIVQWWTAPTCGAAGGCIEIGILLFPEHRGRGLGTAAQQALADHLFSTTLANRLQASTDIDNTTEQRSLERVGFHREGIMRGAAFTRGEWRDLALYARLRDDPV